MNNVLNVSNKMGIDTEVCRVCLATNCKMYSVVRGPLMEVLKALVNYDVFPVSVCWECEGRLRSTVRLQRKAMSAQRLLTNILQGYHEMSLQYLKTMNRYEHNLGPDLILVSTDSVSIEPTKVNSINTEHTVVIKKEVAEPKHVEENSCDGDAISDDMLNVCLFPVDTIKSDGFIDGNDESCDDFDDDTPILNVAVKKEYREFRKSKKRKAEGKTVQVKKPKADTQSIAPGIRTKKKSKREKEVEKALSVGFKVTRLTHEQQVEEFQKKKDNRRYLRHPFKCTLCLTSFSNEHKYNNHMTRHNEEWGKYECAICKIRTKSLLKLRKHIVGWHLEKYSCRQCKMFTKNRSAARRHLEWHSGTVFKCPSCPAEFSHLSTYLSHRRLKHVSEYVCELCGYSFISRKGIQTHKDRMHLLEAAKTQEIMEGPHCAECDVKFISQVAYDRHLALSAKHSSDENLREMRHDGKLSSLNPINIEARKAMMRRPITCELCGAVVMGRMAYAWHFRKQHPGQKRMQYPPSTSATAREYLCDKCGKAFMNYNLWWSHTLVHSVEKRFQCELCKKQFNRHNMFMMHMRNHSAERETFECKECGQKLSNKGNLARHMLIHGGLRKFKCKSCEKSFVTSDGLRAHTNHVHLKIPWPARVRSGRRHNNN